MPIVIRRRMGIVADPIVRDVPVGSAPDYSSPAFQAELRQDVRNFFKALARDHARALHKRLHPEEPE